MVYQSRGIAMTSPNLKWKSTGGENIVRPILHLQFDTFSSCILRIFHDHARKDEEEIDLHVEKSGYLEMEINTYLRNERKKMWFVLIEAGNLSGTAIAADKDEGLCAPQWRRGDCGQREECSLREARSTMKETRSSCFRR